MPQRYELLTFTSKMPVRCTMQEITRLEQHLHDSFEIDLILEGKCRAAVGDQVYSLVPEDVLTIDSHVPHSFQSSGCMLICVQFEQSLFERTLSNPQHPKFDCNSSKQGNSAAFDDIRTIIARLIKNNADRQTGFELRNWSLIYDLMDLLYNNFRIDESGSALGKSHRYTMRIAEISDIVNRHYAENFSLSALAETVHLSAPYLSRFFDRHFGMTYLTYLTQIRLNHAVDELLHTDDTIETVSANSGFPNSHAFVQAFKKEYGVLPSLYRRQHRVLKKPEMSVIQHDHMACIRKYLKPPTPETKRNSSVNCFARCSATAQLLALRHSWRDMITVSSAHALLLSDTQQMISRLQKEIGFSYIKFNGILSDEMRLYDTDSKGKPIYSFAYVDKALDFLMSVELRPLIQLTFMPEQLAKNPGKKLFNYLVSEPHNLEQWALMIQALVKHLLTRYGIAEVNRWRFSVWDQPNTPETLYGFSSDDAFYRFYKCSYDAVKACGASLQVGAPAVYYILDDKYEKWHLLFWEWCRANDCEPDFFNFHYYDTVLHGDAGIGREAFGFVSSMTLRENPNGFPEFIDQVRRDCLPFKKPVYLTEWNNTPSQQDLLNDTCFKSCYIVKSILESYDKLDSFGYWTLTDWMGEAPQPEQLFFGGLGLFTVNGIPKASYYAFTLLRRLGSALIGRGDGWFVTRSGDTFQVLMYNYRHFSYLYSLGERFDMTFTDRYTPFSPEQDLDVHLTITDVEYTKYMVRETILSRKSGSSFDQWLEMGALELETAAEYENLTARSLPQTRKYLTEARNGILEIDSLLDMLEVRLVEISPDYSCQSAYRSR